MKEILAKIGNYIKKLMGNYWLFGIAIIMFGASIFFNINDINNDNYGLILGFVGILATFIVVGNYAQVMTIKKDSDDNIDKLSKLILELKSSQSQTEKNLLESKGFFHYSMGVTFATQKYHDTAFTGFANSLLYFIKSNSPEINKCFNTVEYMLNNQLISKTQFENSNLTTLIEEIKNECNTPQLLYIRDKLNIAVNKLN